jgi:hypothetical protein
MLHYDRFSSYQIVRDPAVGTDELAIVPESELQALIEFANLAVAAGPANCNHPADSLQPFELIMDCCVCGECCAVLKNYANREALALGIEPGWHKLTAEMLDSEIRNALKSAIDILEYVSVATGQYGDARDVMGWAEVSARGETFRKLEKVR